jgi:hypothetical protein
MYYNLTGVLKRRLILELQDSFADHPLYEKIVPYIQNKFAFSERPQAGIVVKGASGNKIQLSADNYMGTLSSYVMLAQFGAPANPLEWVREDLKCVSEGGGMPTPPGVYFLEILTAPTTPETSGTFAMDPLLTVTGEAVLLFQSGIEREAQLQNVPVSGTLRLWEGHRYLMKEGYDYQVDYETGAITFLERFSGGSEVTADYRYAVASVGPVEFYWNTADFNTLPGVVLAFGKRAKVGDTVAIVVYQDRVETAKVYGGKWEGSFDTDVITRDTVQTEEIADLIFMYLWSQKRSKLAFEGIEIVDVSQGGEAEDLYDETGDLYFYTSSMSVQLQADWEVHIPLPLTISRVTPNTPSGDIDPSAASGMVLVGSQLFYRTQDSDSDFERIK